MSVFATGVIGGRTAADAPRVQAGRTPRDLLNTIGKYIPTDVTTAYVAAAGAMALVQPPIADDFKRNVAILVAVIAAFAALIVAVVTARETAPNIGVGTVAMGAWFEILAAPVAFLIWSAAIPDSWYDWGVTDSFMPVLVVTLASIVVGGLAVLLNRNRG
jgi:hypothetical protein